MVYGQFATVYDRLMTDAPYNEWVQFTKSILKQYSIEPSTILDLGCGTGEISIRLHQLGYDVIGVDFSAEMLSIAQQKELNHHKKMKWIQQDIRQLSGFSNIDVCISYCDVINYITDQEGLEHVFQRVYQSLKPAGLFMFDTHDLSYVTDYLINQTFTELSEELTYIWECEAGVAQGEMFHYLTFFQRLDNGQYIRFDERHHQQTYSPDFYEQVLKNVGFTKITFYSDFQSDYAVLSEKSQRNFIIAQK